MTLYLLMPLPTLVPCCSVCYGYSWPLIIEEGKEVGHRCLCPGVPGPPFLTLPTGRGFYWHVASPWAWQMVWKVDVRVGAGSCRKLASQLAMNGNMQGPASDLQWGVLLPWNRGCIPWVSQGCLQPELEKQVIA